MSLAAQPRVFGAVESNRDKSPSRWSARLRIAILAFGGLAISSYLAAYQFGLVRHVWEPFFGNGSERVLHSFISRLLPLPDATLGAIVYLVELVVSLIGGPDRYRSRAVLVLAYGGVVGAAALVAVGLGSIQAFGIEAGCTLCLCSAVISLVIACLATDEVFAAIEVIYEKRKT